MWLYIHIVGSILFTGITVWKEPQVRKRWILTLQYSASGGPCKKIALLAPTVMLQQRRASPGKAEKWEISNLAGLDYIYMQSRTGSQKNFGLSFHLLDKVPNKII